MPTLQGAWNAFWGIETKAAAPPWCRPRRCSRWSGAPARTPTPRGDYWNPLIATGSGSTTTWNSAVFACLALKAKAFQEAPLRIFRFLGDGTKEWLDDHPFMELVADPHPSLSQPEVNFWLSTCLDTAGEAFLRKIRDRAGRGDPALAPVPPDRDPGDHRGRTAGRGVHLALRGGRRQGPREELPVEDVIHFRNGVDDTDHRRGMSPLRRLLREVASDEEATRFLEDLLANFAVASLAVTVPPGPVLTEEQAKQIRDRLREDYGGRNRNRGHVAVVANGATLSQVGFTPQQLDLKTAHYIPETRICAVLGVPAMLVGFSVGAGAHHLQQHGAGPGAPVRADHHPPLAPGGRHLHQAAAAPDYTPDRSIRLRYDLMDVRALQEDENEKWARLSVAVEKAWITKDEARAEVGLDPLPDGLGEAQDPHGAAAAAGGDQRRRRRRWDAGEPERGGAGGEGPGAEGGPAGGKRHPGHAGRAHRADRPAGAGRPGGVLPGAD